MFLNNSVAITSTKTFKILAYDPTKGVKHFYTQLLHASEDMIMVPDQASFNERFINSLPSEIRRELILHEKVSIDFTTKEQLWMAVLCCRQENGPICEPPTETKLMARACLYHRPEIHNEFDTKTEDSTMIPEGG